MRDETTMDPVEAERPHDTGSPAGRCIPPRAACQNSEHGFTLVELLVVLAVAGILAGLTIVGFATLLPKYRLDGAAATVRSDLYSAKIQAANAKRQYRVSFNANGYSIQQGDKSTGSTIWTHVSSRQITNEYSGVTIDMGSTSNPTFQPRGTATNDTIVVQNDRGDTRTITITLAGRVKVL